MIVIEGLLYISDLRYNWRKKIKNSKKSRSYFNIYGNEFSYAPLI